MSSRNPKSIPLEQVARIGKIGQSVYNVKNRFLNPWTEFPIRICHVSDMHLGSLETEHSSAGKSIWQTLLKLLMDLPAKDKPDFLVISGDIITCGLADSFTTFSLFVNSIRNGECLRKSKGYPPEERIIVVPGNHDVVWKEGKSDMRSFREICDSHNLNTPFASLDGTEKNTASEQMAFRLEIESEQTQPCTIYYYPEYRLIFLAMVSSHGQIDVLKECREKIKEAADKIKEMGGKELAELLKSMVSKSKGYIDQDYCERLEKTIRKSRKSSFINEQLRSLFFDSSLRFGVVHHHLDREYCGDSCPNKSDELRNILWDQEFRAVLHGHIHHTPSHLNFHEGHVELLPCGTLSCLTVGVSNTFNMLELSPEKKEEKPTTTLRNNAKIDIYKYDYDPSSSGFVSPQSIYGEINDQQRFNKKA